MTVETIVNDIKAGYVTFEDAVKTANKLLDREEQFKSASKKALWHWKYTLWRDAICIAVKENLWK